MKLKNPFPDEVRLLFLYCYSCFKCGRSDRGLELHHIVGRSSDSAFNACPLCTTCHVAILHTHEEEKALCQTVIDFLVNEQYQPSAKDYKFLTENLYLIT